ncbi:MAG: response regulator [Flavobacteriales bacterium]|nr:response regulator [Flavobacteriales bacterium]
MIGPIDHIVLIDDEDDCHFVTRLILKKAGFTGSIRSFNSAYEALSAMRAGLGEVDLLLVDINMPGMTGFEFVETCEREGLLPRGGTSVIMVSSSNRPQDLNRARGMGSINDYVEKSLTIEQFERITHAHLQRA